MHSTSAETMEKPTLVLVLGDQLSPSISSLKTADPATTVVLMVEVEREATQVRYHRKKIAFLFSAMRHFAEELRDAGWNVDYVKLDDEGNTGSFGGEVLRAVRRHAASRVVVTHPGEWRVLEELRGLEVQVRVPVEIPNDDRFLCTTAEFNAWAEGRRSLRMEYFYREMRRAHGLLMEGDNPLGGQWNFDQDNRKAAAADLPLPDIAGFEPDEITREVLELVSTRFADHPGELEPFWFAVTRADAQLALEVFLHEALPGFGDYQDAMLARSPFLFHSVISHYLNCGLLDPLEVCRAAEVEVREGRAPLYAVEGFVRQILGWREYVRGIYWLKMPRYERSNFFGATRALPAFYWTGETKMNCVASCVGQTMREAYAHHIQRLMITGNFALLAGIDPFELHEWYLAVYADAYEWVELPNTVGMSQFADGGLLASKPYVSGGNYIRRMSDYCDGCSYDVLEKTGPKACPFNYLYWDFAARNRDKLADNARFGQVYGTLDRMTESRRAEIAESAKVFLASLE
jgi:deoxyribodipyrimidine photolyase-related protein